MRWTPRHPAVRGRLLYTVEAVEQRRGAQAAASCSARMRSLGRWCTICIAESLLREPRTLAGRGFLVSGVVVRFLRNQHIDGRVRKHERELIE